MRNSRQEFLLHNFLDKEFQKMFHPLNLLQTILLQSKFKILRGFVTPNNIFDNCLCVFGAGLIVIHHIVRCIVIIQEYNITPNPISELNDLYKFSPVMDLLIYGIFSVIISTANIQASCKNVELMLRVQRAYMVLREDDKGIIQFRRNNWMCLILLFMTYGLILLNLAVYVSFKDLICYLPIIYFDANILFGIRIIALLVYELRMLKKALEIFGTVGSESNSDQIWTSSDISEHGKKLLRTYLDIMKAFQLTENAIQASILFLVTEIFLHFLYSVQNLILIQLGTHFLDEISVIGVHVILLSCSLSVKNFVLLICLCAVCQQFYQAAAGVDVACTVLLSQHNDPPDYVRQLCKNVCRASSCCSVLRAGGLIAVCAALPLQQLQLLATYTILFLVTEIFLHFLYSVQNLILIQLGTHFLDEISVIGVHVILLSCSLSVKNFVLLICLCAVCQQFYQAAAGVDVACTVLLSQHNDPPDYVRQLCKNVCRASSCCSVLRAGGLIAVCAALPLQQLQLLATYTVVLLQFAFL